VLSLALVALAHPARADDGWRRVASDHGIVVEARDVPGSSLHEVRATTHAEPPPAAILAVLWRHEEHPQFWPHVRHVEVVRDDGDERIVYEQLDIPLLKDRDVVLRVRRTTGADGTVDVQTTAISDEGPPATSRFVRIRESAGHWHLAPAGGGTDITYTVRSDVGLPAWLVNRAQRETIPDVVRAVIARAGRD
jgi:hypothetical protein